MINSRLEAIAVHAGTDRITNPAVHDHRKITVLPSKYLSKTGTATPAVFMLLGIARASSIHTAENEVAQRLGMLPLDLTWYRSAGLFSHALGCNELYYPTWADDVRFSTMGKIRASTYCLNGIELIGHRGFVFPLIRSTITCSRCDRARWQQKEICARERRERSR